MNDTQHVLSRRARAPVALVVVLVLAALAAGHWLGGWRATAGAEGANPAAGAEAAGQLWTCGMHPQVIRDGPGICPICHMDLTPIDPAASAGGLAIDPVVVQNMGLRVTPVRKERLERTVRAFGSLTEREPDHRDVTLRVGGWIERLFAATDGQRVEEGEPLFELYSPALTVAIEELIAARAARDASPDSANVRAVYAAGRQKLQLLGLAAAQVDALEAAERAPATVTFLSPIDGHVTNRSVYAGAAVQPGERVLTLADNRRLWIDVQVFERDLALLEVGQAVRARVAARPGATFPGEVIFVHPHLDMRTRTAKVRLEVDNPERFLREGMYATVEIDTAGVPDALVVPREAVIDTGLRRVAFVSLGAGRFDPRDVELGAFGDGGLVEVRAGLAAGDMVVVSGQFLLDAESRIRESIRRHLDAGLPGHEEQPGVTPAGERAAEREAPQERIDALFRAYVDVVTRLGEVSTTADDYDAGPMAAAARLLERDARLETRRLAGEIARSAEEIARRPGTERRQAFAPLSELFIALADRSPASAAVAPALFVVHCPMAPGSWLQTHEDVENPYYQKAMKACGEVVRSIPSVDGK